MIEAMFYPKNNRHCPWDECGFFWHCEPRMLLKSGIYGKQASGSDARHKVSYNPGIWSAKRAFDPLPKGRAEYTNTLMAATATLRIVAFQIAKMSSEALE